MNKRILLLALLLQCIPSLATDFSSPEFNQLSVLLCKDKMGSLLFDIGVNSNGNIFVVESSSTGRVYQFNYLSPAEKNVNTTNLFNGRNLKGWNVPIGNEENGWYKPVGGILQLRSGPKKKGSVLWTKKEYTDFVLNLEFRFVEGIIDSGIHLRNKDQIQIGISGSLKRDMTGSPYIPGKGYPVEAKSIAQLLRMNEWNQMKIRAIGSKYTVWLQEEEVMSYESTSAKKIGPIGIQLHGNRNMAIDFKNIEIREI
ncbi:MAG: hypothetical protein CMI27_06790 [Opitutae bacterium]|nr:hypothetical protein [Opitutae bacterium]